MQQTDGQGATAMTRYGGIKNNGAGRTRAPDRRRTGCVKTRPQDNSSRQSWKHGAASQKTLEEVVVQMLQSLPLYGQSVDAIKTASTRSVRLAFIAAYALYLSNLSFVLKLGSLNSLIRGMLILAVLILVSKSRVYMFNAFLGLFCLAMIFILGSMTTYRGFSYSILINGANQLILLFAVLSIRPKPGDRLFLLTAAALMPVICVGLGVLYQGAGLRPLFGHEYSTDGFRLQGSLIASELSALGMAGVIASMVLLLGGASRRFAWVFLLDIFILAGAGGRMTLFVALLVSAGIFLVTPSIGMGRKIVFGVLAVLAAVIIVPLFGQALITRFLESGANGRDTMWTYILYMAEQYSASGIGFGHQFYAMPENIIMIVGSAAAHNDYFRIYLELGAVGAMLFFSCLALAALRACIRPDFMLPLLCFIGAGLIMLTDNFLANSAFLQLIIVAQCGALGAGAAFMKEVPKPSRDQRGAIGQPGLA